MPAERFKTFVDAVVAIAMTLLILPLLEAVNQAAEANLSTAQFFTAHGAQLMNFIISLVMIAAFWLENHRMYHGVDRMTLTLLWINIGWLLTIVWLPVATAMLGQLEHDPLQALVYIGTLILTQVTTLCAKLYLIRHPGISDIPVPVLRQGALGDIVSIALFTVALLIAAYVHAVGYFALLLAAFAGPLQRVFTRTRLEAEPNER